MCSESIAPYDVGIPIDTDILVRFAENNVPECYFIPKFFLFLTNDIRLEKIIGNLTGKKALLQFM